MTEEARKQYETLISMLIECSERESLPIDRDRLNRELAKLAMIGGRDDTLSIARFIADLYVAVMGSSTRSVSSAQQNETICNDGTDDRSCCDDEQSEHDD